MYNPFVLACNYALDQLSRVQVEGLPPFSEEKQIVFVRNHDRPVHSHNHQRDCRARPDIVLLQWQFLKEQSKASSYSVSHKGDICTSNSNLKLSWSNVRSTVEMKFGAFSKRKKQKEPFDKEFGDLNESKPYISLDDNVQSGFIQEDLPESSREHVPLGGFPLLIFLCSRHPKIGEAGCEGRPPHGG